MKEKKKKKDKSWRDNERRRTERTENINVEWIIERTNEPQTPKRRKGEKVMMR